MTIRSKILAGCLALTVLTALLGLYAQRAERDLGTLALRIYDEAFMGVSYLRSAQAGSALLATGARYGQLDPEAVAGVIGDLEVARARAMSPEGRADADHLAAAVAAVAKRGIGPSDPALKDVQAGFEHAVEVFADDGFRYRQGVGRMVAAQQRQMTVVLILTLLGALAITFVLSGMIAPPVRRAVRIAQAIAAGRLDNAIPVTGRGETAELLQALATMQGSIAAALGKIRALMADQAASHAGELAQQHARLEAALGNMNQGLCLFGADGRLAVANRRFGEMFGVPEAGTPVERVMRDAGLLRLLGSARDGAVAALSCDLPDGRSIAVSQQPIAQGGWVATYEDTTERRATEARLFHMARHDPLTGLPNRLAYSEHLPEVLARARRGASVAVLRLGLDRFNSVNDALGQAAGDALLGVLARRLKEATRETDFLVRLGGDEFAVVQESPDQPADAAMLAGRLAALVSEPYEVAQQQAVIGVSIGIVLASGTEGADGLLQAAGLALHRAKAEGRGTPRFYEIGMDAELQAQRALEADLRRALPEGQLELFYQPLVHASGIAGFEALLRWRHPTRGLVSPAEFIPLAEEAGLIGEIGAWVLVEACAEAAGWPGALTVAVNLSPAQFRTRSLVDDAGQALAASGLPASRLELEITESVLLQDDDGVLGDGVLGALHALRGMGIRIAMDDFGTGYSSLSYLRRFPFDKIKIDQSFVRGITTQEDCRKIVRAVIGLGRSLGMAVNAEGVETPEHLEALRLEGCGELQGYLFSKPKPAGEVPEMLRQYGNATLAAGQPAGRRSPVAV
jgi:diguanylate cyclase (GGDEF)-like protein